jgi:hypothetical protein
LLSLYINPRLEQPLLSFKSLERKANKDKKWRAINCAIGNIEEL